MPQSQPGLSPALVAAAALRRELTRLGTSPLPAAELLARARRIVRRYEPVLARALRDAMLAGFLREAKRWARPAAPQVLAPPPPPPFRPTHAEPPGLVRLPIIERAAADLARREILTTEQFLQLDQDARRAAFTVARVQSTATLEKVRAALVVDISEGGTLRDFRKRLDGALDSVLSRPQVEGLYRTQVGQAMAAGQREVLAHPLVADEFPYVLWSATHDSRTRPDHLAMEKHGQNGTAVYRLDDPIWRTLWPPAGYNCRCVILPLSIEDAAQHGSREARRWLKTGLPPAVPDFAATPYPITPPPGWPTQASVAAIV